MERYIGIKKLCGFIFIISGICWILQTIGVIIGALAGDYWFIDARLEYVGNLLLCVLSGLVIKILGGSIFKINGNGYKP